MEAFQNTVKIKKIEPYENKLYTEVFGSKTNTENIRMAQPDNNTHPNTTLDPINRRGGYIAKQTRTGKSTISSSRINLNQQIYLG